MLTILEYWDLLITLQEMQSNHAFVQDLVNQTEVCQRALDRSLRLLDAWEDLRKNDPLKKAYYKKCIHEAKVLIRQSRGRVKWYQRTVIDMRELFFATED